MKLAHRAARLPAVACAVLSTAGVVDAYSKGAGTCVVGADGPDFPYSPHFGFGKGSLGSGGDGPFKVELGNSILTADAGTNVAAGVVLPINLSAAAAGGSFKGFLITLQADDGKDLSGSLAKVGADDPLKIIDEGSGAQVECPAMVAGATHTNADPKESVSAMMKFGEGISGPVNLTVTVMEAKEMWYFSTFALDVEAAGEQGAPTTAETDAPTKAPTADGGVTDAPTKAPAAAGTTDAPTKAPAAAGATGAPTGSPSHAPTAAPSGAPVVGGGTAPALAAAVATLTWLFA